MKTIIIAIALLLAGCSSDDGGTLGGGGELERELIEMANDIKIDVEPIDLPDIDLSGLEPIEPLPELKFDLDG